MATTTTNGRPARPTLADQIARLDRLVDGLSENLAEMVVDAARAAVVAAVQEVLSNPAVLAKLRDALPTATPATLPVATPVRGPRLKERLARAWSWLGAKVRSVVGAGQAGLHRLGAAAAWQCQRVQKAAQAVWLRLRLLRHFRGQLLLAAGVGVAAGVAAFLAAPWLAALLSGLGGFMTALVVQGGVVLLRLAAAGCPPRN